MSASLSDRLAACDSSQEQALDAFLEWAADLGISLYPAQEEAVLELFDGHHVILKTPTGSGKSLVATALHTRAMSQGLRSVYTAPIKALVSEKFRALCDLFGAEDVGLMTGDGSVNREAPILCCTAEILAKIALRHGEETPYEAVIMDEFHYYGDRDRGMAWQLPLLTMPHAQFLLLSATLGDTSNIAADLEARTGHPVATVDQAERPVPLSFEYSEIPADQALNKLVHGDKAPVYAVHFTQRAATELAQALTSSNLIDDEAKAIIRKSVKAFRFDSPFGPTLRKYVLHGVGLHHAGLLPKYRMLVESLAQRGLLAVICGTDTLGVGINVPIRSVFFTQLCKFDGENVELLTVRDFQQIAGRSGRKGFDTEGTVVVQAPDWVISNARLSDAVASGKKKRGKVVKKKPPTRGYKHWDRPIFERMVAGQPEKLEGRFTVDHSLVLQLLQKASETLGDAMEELADLIERSHTGQRQTARLMTEAQARLFELTEAGIVVDHGEEAVPRYAITGDLQDDLSLHHSLSLFLIHAIDLLDRDALDYALNVVSLVEAIVPHPKVILRAQVHREKGHMVMAMKAEGIPYEERMEKLEEVTWPKPKGEWIYETYDTYAKHTPWLATEPIRPKSVAREIIEVRNTFAAWVKSLQLERSEGVVLRYLSQIYSTLLHNVPESARTPELDDIVGFLRALLARVDDSLVKTWEAMVSPTELVEEAKPVDISADIKRFRARIRQELYAVVRAMSVKDYAEAAACAWHGDDALEASDIEAMIRPYVEERGGVTFDPRMKKGWTTQVVDDGPHRWRVTQVLVDDETNSDDDDAGEAWSIDGVVDLTGDTNPSGPIVRLVRIGP